MNWLVIEWISNSQLNIHVESLKMSGFLNVIIWLKKIDFYSGPTVIQQASFHPKWKFILPFFPTVWKLCIHTHMANPLTIALKFQQIVFADHLYISAASPVQLSGNVAAESSPCSAKE